MLKAFCRSMIALLLVSSISFAADKLPSETNSLEMRMVKVPSGEYLRGEMHGDLLRRNHPFSTGSVGSNSERPAHPVQISQAFWMADSEVTVGQFRKFVEATGYRTTAESSGDGSLVLIADAEEGLEQFQLRAECNWRSPGFPQKDDHPVVCVSWQDAQAFCDWLSEKENARYRLPTEAQWEYAARSGTTTSYLGGDLPDTIYAFGNVADATLEEAHPGMVLRQRIAKLNPSDGDGAAYTAPVRSFQPNRWGIYDTHGNVWEWCSDKYYDRYYTELTTAAQKKGSLQQPAVTIDPPGPETTPNHEFGDWRSMRGGAWCTGPISSRSASRSFGEAGDAFSYVGFRVIRED